MPSHCSVRSCSDRLKQLLLPCFSFRFTNYSTSNAMSSAGSASTSSAATEHGTEPLLQSTAGRILKKVYNAPGHRRMAQAFLCTMPGEGDEEGIDVVNVHALSGTPKLTDAQRFQLIRNLLQSSSMTRANKPIGEGRFLIGGDMNTTEHYYRA